MQQRRDPLPAHASHVYGAHALRVAIGANLGDAITRAEYCEPGDIYRLVPSAEPIRILLRPVPGEYQQQELAAGSGIGNEGDRIEFLSLLTLMAPDGDRVETVIVRHVDSGEEYALPLSPIAPRTDYTLIAASDDVGGIRIADIVCVSFAAGTLITLPGGNQQTIESLRPGDAVLTRDHGPQTIRWIGKATFRARGGFAPIVITAGTLGNHADLIVSPHHRVFIYQRGRHRVGGVAELLVQAKHLVDDESVIRREGGFVDYFSLVFDQHEIIYAEGIPAESLLINEATVSLLPSELAEEVQARFPGLSQSQHFGTEAGRELVDDAMRATIFQRGKRD